MISTHEFIESLPLWVWVFQGHAHPNIRFFYRIPREVLYHLINYPQGRVDSAGGWVYELAREAGIEPVRIIAFVHGEPVTYVAIEN